ncbi:MAG: AMP-binding protein, partial [bacterium]|nr:AMP-binding protein [bacterium]
MSDLPEWFQQTRWVPPPGSLESRRVTRFMRRHGLEDYQSMLRRAAAEPKWFYPAVFEDLDLEWMEPFHTVVDDSAGQARARWFVDGRTNVAHLACSRWKQKEGPALLWEGDDGATSSVTFAELEDAVSRAAAGLRSLGINTGDVVALYAPMLPEAVVALLATARIGAIAMTLFSGYGKSALAERLQLARAKLVVTVDGFLRGGKSF